MGCTTSRAINKYGPLGSAKLPSAMEMSMPTSTTSRDSKRKTPREEPKAVVRTQSVSVKPAAQSRGATPESSTQAKNHSKRKPGGNKGHSRNASTDSRQRLNVSSPVPSERDSILSSTHSYIPSVSSASSVEEMIPIKIDVRDLPLVQHPPSPARERGSEPQNSPGVFRKAASAPTGGSLLRAFSDSAMYANSFHEKLLRRPAFLSRQKPTKTPLTALQEQTAQVTSPPPTKSPDRGYVLPEIGPHYLHEPFTLPEAADSPSVKPTDSMDLRKPKAKSVLPTKPKPTFHLPPTKSLSTDPPLPVTTNPLVPPISIPAKSPSKFKFRFTEKRNLSAKRSPTQTVRQVVDAVRSPTQAVKHVVGAVMDKEGEKVVCGLPCNSRRKEKELKYTLEILTGVRVRKVDKEGEEKGFKIGKVGTKRVTKKKSKTLKV